MNANLNNAQIISTSDEYYRPLLELAWKISDKPVYNYQDVYESLSGELDRLNEKNGKLEELVLKLRSKNRKLIKAFGAVVNDH